jgi:uncharacterized protein (DUF2141 family)
MMERLLRFINASWFPGILIVLALLLFALFAFSPKQADAPKNTNTGTLTVHVTGLRNNKGNVIVCLYKAGPFMNRGNITTFREISSTGDTLTATFTGIPFREYGVFEFHDENQNRTPDISADKIRLEGIGISNISITPDEVPDFDKAKFDFNSKNMELTIPIVYYNK